MKRFIKTTGLCRNIAKKGYAPFEGLDLTGIGFCTDGTPSQFYHSKLGWGYGFNDEETMLWKGKIMKDYESSNPWQHDYMDISDTLQNSTEPREIIHVANQLTEDYYYNAQVITDFNSDPRVNLIGVELMNEPYQKDFDISFEEFRRNSSIYLSHGQAPIVMPIVAQNDRAGYRSSAAFLTFMEEIPVVATHKYFSVLKLEEELAEYVEHLTYLRSILPEETEIWVTETNIHKDYIGDIAPDTLWDCWELIYSAFENAGVTLTCGINLYSYDVYHLIHPKQGVRTKLDGTPLIDFFKQ